jgi:hypothetical protein
MPFIKNKKLKLALTLAAVLSPLVIISVIGYYSNPSRYRFNGDQMFSLTDEWLELSPKHPIACNKEFQQLYLTLITPYEIQTYGPGSPRVILQDGTTPEIECELVSTDGAVYPYRYAGIVSEGKAQYIMFDEKGHLFQTARKRAYRAVRLRSSRPIVCAEARLDCHRPPFE